MVAKSSRNLLIGIMRMFFSYQQRWQVFYIFNLYQEFTVSLRLEDFIQSRLMNTLPHGKVYELLTSADGHTVKWFLASHLYLNYCDWFWSISDLTSKDQFSWPPQVPSPLTSSLTTASPTSFMLQQCWVQKKVSYISVVLHKLLPSPTYLKWILAPYLPTLFA